MTRRWSAGQLCIGVFVFLWLPILYRYGYRAPLAAQNDFASFYLSARAVLEGGVSPYDVAGLRALGAQLGLTEWVFPFLYPPPSLLPFLPLGFFSHRAAVALLSVVSQGALLGSAWLVLRRVLRLPAPGTELVSLACVVYFAAFDPIVETLQLGQTNLVILACLAAVWCLAREGRGAWLGGVCLALACLLKIYFAPLLLVFLLRRRFRMVAVAVGALAALTLAAAWLLPAGVWSSWLGEIAPTGSYGESPRGLFSPTDPGNQSVAGFIARLFLGDSAPLAGFAGWCVPLTWLAAAAVAGSSTAAIGVSLRRTDSPEAFDRELSVALLAIYLIAPFSWEHHLCVLLPAALLCLRDVLGGDSLPRAPRLALLAGLAVLAWEVPIGAPFMKHGWSVVLTSSKLAAVGGLWLYFLRESLRSAPSSERLGLPTRSAT